jgi:glycopeptide antibiotics resistance protein
MGARGAIAVAAIVVGALVAVLLFVPFVARQYRRRGRFGIGHAVLAGAFLVYVIALLGFVLLPLPSDITALCARGGVRAQTQPFYVVGDVARSRTGTGISAWLRSPPVVPLLFNIALFVPLGMLVRHLFGRGRSVTVAIGFGVSLLVECTQLTGNWFLFPCAYRQFNVDDLIANTAGAALGVLLAPVLRLVERTDPTTRPRAVTVWRRWLGMACDWLAHTLLGLFLVTLVPELHLLVTGHYLDSDVWFLRIEPILEWWVPGLLLFVLPSLAGSGGSVGQRSVLLCPVRPDGRRLSSGHRLLRVMLGSGLYALVGGLGSLGVGPSVLAAAVLSAFVLATVVAAGPTRNHRGLSLVSTSLDLADRTRVDPTAPAPPLPADEGDPMVEPLLLSIATTLATKAAGSLYDLVRKAFQRHPDATAALQAADGAAPESASVRALAERLDEVSTQDPEFGRQLRAEWANAGGRQQADNGGVTNQITGTVTGKVVQARDIQGGISF